MSSDADTSQVTTPAQLFAFLDELGIETTTIEHPPVFTVEEAKQHRGRIDGSHIKNLFLRNKKKRMWLLVAPEDRTIQLKSLGKQLGAGHMSFASPSRLMQHLGVEPGSVTPFGVINDAECQVQVVLDGAVLERDPVQCHPLVNTMTTAISAKDLLKFLEATNHEPQIIDLG